MHSSEHIVEVLSLYSKSGKGELEVFPKYVDGFPIMSYMNCVFKHSPTLEMVLQKLGDGNRAGCGQENSEVAEHTDLERNKFCLRERSSYETKRKPMTDHGLK